MPALSWHHYIEGGLSYVWLQDGFVRQETAYGPVVMVENAPALELAIALHVVQNLSELTGHEFRFLRGLMGLSVDDLAKLLGTGAKSVARREKTGARIPPVEDRAIRQLFLEYTGMEQSFTTTVRQVSSIVSDFSTLWAYLGSDQKWNIQPNYITYS